MTTTAELPTLTGSPKQVAWATSIRTAMRAKGAIASSFASSWTNYLGERPERADRLVVALAARDAEIQWTNPESRYWIDSFSRICRRDEDEAYWQAYIDHCATSAENETQERMDRNNASRLIADEYLDAAVKRY